MTRPLSLSRSSPPYRPPATTLDLPFRFPSSRPPSPSLRRTTTTPDPITAPTKRRRPRLPNPVDLPSPLLPRFPLPLSDPWRNLKSEIMEKVRRASHAGSWYTSNPHRGGLGNLYQDASMLTFEGQKVQGAQNIVAKLTSLPFQQCQHSITTVDCQPSGAGGVLVFVSGNLQLVGEQHALKFSQEKFQQRKNTQEEATTSQALITPPSETDMFLITPTAREHKE